MNVLDRIQSLPEQILWKMTKFFLDGKTGQVIFNVKDGKIMVVDLKETMRVELHKN